MGAKSIAASTGIGAATGFAVGGPVGAGIGALVGFFKGLSGSKQADAEKAAGEAQQRAAESDALIQEFNATVADQQAADAIARGREEELRFRGQVRGLIGSQRASFAGGNVDVDFGSSVDVQADSAYLGELDAQQIVINAARDAWGFQVQAVDYRNRAAVERKTGQQLAAAGRAAASATILGGVASEVADAGSLLLSRYGKK